MLRLPVRTCWTYTDDTRLKHLFYEAIIRKGGRITADDLAETWLELMKGWYYTPVLNAYFKLAVICQQIFYRWHVGQTKDARFQAHEGLACALIRHAAELAAVSG